MAAALLGMSVVVLLGGAPPSVSDPTAHGTVRQGSAPGHQRGAHAATLGGTSMVVWTDERAGNDHWGTRLELDGRRPDGTGRRLPTTGPVAASAIASSPGGWWRVWAEGLAYPYTVYGQLLAADGTPAGAPLLLGPPGKATLPSAAWSGQEYVTVWADLTDPQLVGARTTLDGGVQTVAMSTPTPADSASVACGGAVCLVVFKSPSPAPVSKDVRGRFFDPSTLQFVTSELTISSTPNDELDPVVAYEPSTDSFVVAWRESAASADVHLAAVRSDGGITGPVPLEQTSEDEEEPTVSCRADGANLCAVAFRSGGGQQDIHLWRVRGDLSLVGGAPQTFAAANGSVFSPSVSLAPGGGALVWHGRSTSWAGGEDVFGVPLDDQGLALGSPALLSTAANGQELPAVAVGGGRSWFFWRDGAREPGPGNYQVSVAVPSSWSVDDHDVSTGAESGDRGAIAPYGKEAVAVWGDDGPSVRLGFARIDELGGLQHSGHAMSALGGCRGPAAIGFRDLVAVAVPCAGPALWATAYQDGGFIPEVKISGLGSTITDPAFGTDGERLVLVWSDDRSGVPAIHGVRLDDSGSLDGDGVALAATDGAQTRPAVAHTDGTWLVAWQDDSGDAGTRILGARFGVDWTPLDGQPLVLRQGASRSSAPRLLSIPGGFLLAWVEDANRGDVRAALVDLAGVAGQPFDISASPEWEGQVSLAPGRTGAEALAAYSAIDLSDGVASRRVYTRWIDLDGPDVVDGVDGGIPVNDPFGIGCDCTSAGGGAFWVALLLAAGAAARVRPRRSAPRP